MKMHKTAGAVKVALLSTLFSASAFAEQPAAEEVETVVVYGQKIERTLQETKESIALVSERQIEDIGLLDLEDAYLSMANVFTLGNGENFGIRGITQNRLATGGGGGQLGSFYMDGVAYTGFATRFGPRDLWDVQQIEVLRGPQSTNVGRQALIGAVVVETKDPSLSGFEAAVRGQVGNYNTRSLEGMVNFEVSENSALRLVAEKYQSDGFIDNKLLGIDDYDPDDNLLLRAKYLIEPSNDLSILFTVQKSDIERGWDAYRYDLKPIDSYESSANLLSHETYDGTAASIDVSYDINDEWSVRSVTSYIDGEYNRFNDDDSGPEGGNAFRGRYVEDKNWAQEIRVNYQGDSLRGVFGTYFTTVELFNNTTGIVTLIPSDLGVPPVLLPFYPQELTVNVGIPADNETSNMAFFTEWDWMVNDRLTLSAGFRYDREEQKVLQNAQNTLAEGSALPDPTASGQAAAALGFPPAVVAQIVGGITQVNGLLGSQLTPTDNPLQEEDLNAFLPQIGVTYKVSGDVSVSAFYKKGYRAGGVDVDTVGSIDRYDAEYLDNYELSLRSSHLDGDLTFNANVYYGDWKDQQLTVYVNGSLFDTDIINAGKSTIYGAELELQYALSDSTNIYTSFGYAKTEFDEFCYVDGTAEADISGAKCDAGSDLVGQDLSGNDFAYSPDVSFSFGGRHYINDNWYVAGNSTYQSEAFSDVLNTAKHENGSFTLVNLSAGYIHEDFEASIFVKNAFDKFYTSFLSDDQSSDESGNEFTRNFVTPGTPREVGVIVSYQF